MILVRIDAGISVILVGETGCDKMSLIQFLAKVTGSIFFSCFNVRVDSTENDIVEFSKKYEVEALVKGGCIWIFLGKINTCNHLGMINELTCYHRL